jgi:hypothetical protein
MFLHNLLNFLVQIANKMGLQQKKFLPHVLYTVWCLSKSYAYAKKIVKKKKQTKEKHNSTDKEQC